MTVAACAKTSTTQNGFGSGSNVGESSETPTPTPTPTPATLTITSDRPITKLQPGDPLKFAVVNGDLEDVKVTDADDEEVKGVLKDGVWTPEEPWALNTSYTVTATLTNTDSHAGPTTTVTKKIKSLDGDTNIAEVLYNDATVGVGMPIIIRFRKEVIDADMRAKIEQAMELDISPKQEGAWGWLDQSQLMWRPKDFWKTGTKVSVRGKLKGLPTSSHRWLTRNVEGSFRVGDSRILKVYIDRHKMDVVVNGKVARSIPVTTGKAGSSTTTRSGTKVIIERETTKVMDSSTVGIPEGSSHYYRVKVKYAMRVTYTGEFIHAAPWSEESQGSANVSHGCVGLSTANAKWLFNLCAAGDPVVNTGSNRQFKPSEGIGCWCYDWEGWQKLSAL
ncbi:Ig-like domain-containing protein [Cutibacterium sp.]|uniref:L,D-transpeptidase n=1 Tax=Cutibacterium sp. TaxID=1912221 RepID=UPI0026DD970E|nr:Ig-like domain-containing protein [Cutibacterium sp.]MDO4412503.1 Ig-like domain-containing protein [Cutibacterium sp.]